MKKITKNPRLETGNSALKDLHFTDLMISGGEKRSNVVALVRNMAGAKETLCQLPSEYAENARALYQKCLDHYHQTSQAEFYINHDDVPYRVARMLTIEEPVYCIRRPLTPIPPIESIGYPEPLVEVIKQMGAPKSKGLILLAGSTGSGKTTTIYSALNYYMQTYGDILISIEDPPEVPMTALLNKQTSSCAWYQIDTKDYGGYENALKASMRYNPRYIFLGEIRDPGAAHWAVRAAVNGHVVFSTIHASSPIGAIFSLIQIASTHADSSKELAQSILAEGLSLVIYQSLSLKEGKPTIQTETLYLAPDDFGIRSKIRTGKLEQLSTEISVQELAIQNNKSLIHKD